MAKFPSLLAQDEFGVLAQGLVGYVYDVDDVSATTPLDIFTNTGAAFPGNQITSGPNGVLPDFSCPGYTVVRWISGPFRMDIPCIDQVPAGGGPGQILSKATGTDYDLQWINVPSVPAGGLDGQVLAKDGAVEFATRWIDPPTGGGTVSEGDVDSIVGDLVGSGQGAAVSAMDGRYKQTGLTPLAEMPAGSTLVVRKNGSTWPARPTSRTDIVVMWVGPGSDPTIVTSGNGGALNNVDIRWVI